MKNLSLERFTRSKGYFNGLLKSLWLTEKSWTFVRTARRLPGVTITKSDKGYYKVTTATEIVLNRKAMNMKPAVGMGFSPEE